MLRLMTNPGKQRGDNRSRPGLGFCLFTPRDFDASPCFTIIKATIECGFDPHAVELRWELEDREDCEPMPAVV
jgi:hypothetical protein